MAGKHSPCLLWQYDNRAKTRLENFRRRGVVSKSEFTVEDVGPLIRYDWIVECEGALLLEATDDLEPLGLDRVVRSTYSYHATIKGGPNVVRYDGPDEGESSLSASSLFASRGEDHHSYHHVHNFHPFEEGNESLKRIDREETPTLPEFVEMMIGWYQENNAKVQAVAS